MAKKEKRTKITYQQEDNRKGGIPAYIVVAGELKIGLVAKPASHWVITAMFCADDVLHNGYAADGLFHGFDNNFKTRQDAAEFILDTTIKMYGDLKTAWQELQLEEATPPTGTKDQRHRITVKGFVIEHTNKQTAKLLGKLYRAVLKAASSAPPKRLAKIARLMLLVLLQQHPGDPPNSDMVADLALNVLGEQGRITKGGRTTLIAWAWLLIDELNMAPNACNPDDE